MGIVGSQHHASISPGPALRRTYAVLAPHYVAHPGKLISQQSDFTSRLPSRSPIPAVLIAHGITLPIGHGGGHDGSRYRIIGEGMARTASPMPFDVAVSEEVPTGRIDSLLIARATEQKFG